ncbi:unnamed protein product, partial [Ixodes pacificus]
NLKSRVRKRNIHRVRLISTSNPKPKFCLQSVFGRGSQ